MIYHFSLKLVEKNYNCIFSDLDNYLHAMSLDLFHNANKVPMSVYSNFSAEWGMGIFFPGILGRMIIFWEIMK